jgi:hypothetical protein
MPTLRFERPIHFVIAPLIPQKFRKPIIAVASGTPPMLGTEMPKASIDEHSHTKFWEDKVGLPR